MQIFLNNNVIQPEHIGKQVIEIFDIIVSIIRPLGYGGSAHSARDPYKDEGC
jgi:hypothetical protein